MYQNVLQKVGHELALLSPPPPYNVCRIRRLCGVVDCKTVRIFAYSSTREQSNKRSGTRLCFTDFFTDFEKKTDCFAV